MVGCGGYAADFAASLVGSSIGIDLYFSSRSAGKAAEYCRYYGGQGWYGSYREAAEDHRTDALYICTPHYRHREHAELGIGNGKHILVEKPIAQNLEDGSAIVKAAANARVTLMVAENVRFLAQVRRCRELVSRGAVGELRLVQFQEEHPFKPGGWRSQQSLNGGGVFIDGGIHKVHFMRYLAGEPDIVFASELPKAMEGQEGEDGILVALRWPSGVAGLINHSWTAASPKPPSVEVSGTKGRIRFQVGSGRLDLEQGSDAQAWQLPPDRRGVPAMISEFQQSIQEGREPETSGEEGLRDLTVVLAAYESARQGKAVTVNDLRAG